MKNSFHKYQGISRAVSSAILNNDTKMKTEIAKILYKQIVLLFYYVVSVLFSLKLYPSRY